MKQNNYVIGTVGIATKDIESSLGIIQKGDRVQIVGIDNSRISRGYDLLDLDTGVKVTETGFDSIIPTRTGEIIFDTGTIGVASRDIESLSGTIKKGDRVQIVGIDNSRVSRGYELIGLDTGIKVTETGFDSIIPFIYENANDINKGTKTH